jgi:hypothetical protein
MSSLRTILALSRAARLPTVWSNCLAGWWLGGGGHAEDLARLFGGATLLFVGGAFLNDAFDAEYDRQHRRTRPIPAGAIAQDTVWRWGLGALVMGALLLLWAGRVTGALGLVLVFCIILYNAIHRLLVVSPVLKGLCRFFLYVLGASVAVRGVTGWSVWCGLALAIYMTGVGYFARWEVMSRQARYWPVILLSAPILLALIMDVDGYREAGLVLSAVLGLWVLRSLRQTFWSPERKLDRTVAGLVAGIVFVDWLAVANAPRGLSALFIGLFGLTLVLQQLAPET